MTDRLYGYYATRIYLPFSSLAKRWRRFSRQLRRKHSQDFSSRHLPEIKWRTTRPPLWPRLVEHKKCHGNVRISELVILSSFAAQCPNRTNLFEIGTFDGRTALNLAWNSPDQCQVYTLDLPRTWSTQFSLHEADHALAVGLTLTTAKTGIRLLGTQIVADPHDDLEYWQLASNDRAPVRPRRALLVSIYDQHLVSYKDRRHSLAPEVREKISQAGQDTAAVVLIDGLIVGQWGKSRRGRGFLLTIKLFRPLLAPEKKALQQTAENYGRFLDAPLELSIGTK